MTPTLQRTFSSLSIPNYRRYFTGQVVSISGNWMQTVGELWLIVRLTDSGIAVGLTTALQFLPILLFAVWGGLLADRVSKHKLIMATQWLMVVPVLALWLLTVTGVVEAWMVYGLVFARGLVTAVDNPARQSFVAEIVGAGRVVNAVALNSVVIHSARIIGPAVAGAVIAFVDLSACFLLNALSFGAMLLALRSMDASRLETPRRAPRGGHELRSALSYVKRTPALSIPLAMTAVVGTLSYNFQVLLPLTAHMTWHGTAATYSILTIAMGVGALAGALAAGARGRVDPTILLVSCFGFGVLLLAVAAAPSLELQIAALIPLGALSVTFASGVNSALQLTVDPAMRGRVMALYSMVFLGSTPIGAVIVGALSEVAGPRAGFALGGIAALATAVGARAAFARAPSDPGSADVSAPADRAVATAPAAASSPLANARAARTAYP